jgi:hypothetical protein
VSSAYIRSLRRSLEAQELSAQLSNQGLESRFLTWIDSQPEISRIRPYSMVEMEKALETQGRYLSPILLRHCWERRRKWNGKNQYLRYWVPPLSSE